MSTALEIKQSLAEYADPERVSQTISFFKTGTGSYSEGDQFLGITVPNCRLVAKNHLDTPLPELLKVLQSPWHEERETALIILVHQYKKADAAGRQKIYDLYLAQTAYINNWDLVDVSVRDIVGFHAYDHPEFQADLVRLAHSESLWERRIAMVATWYFLTKGDPEPTKKIATILMDDQHDLIRKAVGWMLREMGKRVSREELILFLADVYKTMPRTALRYAIEHFDAETRGRYLKGEI
jgi:3-methyladenine DNA glycosylase AlkD